MIVTYHCSDCDKPFVVQLTGAPAPSQSWCPECGGGDCPITGAAKQPDTPEALAAKGMPQVGASLTKPAAKKQPKAKPPLTATDLLKVEKFIAAHAVGAKVKPPSGQWGGVYGGSKAVAAAVETGGATAGAGAGAGAATPRTQKAKGIKVLQSHGVLAEGFAKVALTHNAALAAATQVHYPCFVRPCPITPRHGFVDSRVVKTAGELSGVWAETIAADPQGEMIVMPYVDASHNMVWRPGLLGVGPGHDGATGGHDSITVQLQPEYSKAWQTMAMEAGCNLDTSAPFVEAVCSSSHESVITQIRAGVKDAPTEPDWNPAPCVVGEVVTINPAHKADPGAMLAWETTAKSLKAGWHVVHNPGGNLGDHWSVHAMLAGVTVITTFTPVVGQHIAKLGVDLVPLEPQAIIFGFLGGVLGPSLQLPVMRKRAVCAALLGSHHGMMMGGDAGVHIGTSVAMLLRLSQAAIWGEARHVGSQAHPKAGQKVPTWPNAIPKQRNVIYRAILDRWEYGREGLEDRGKVYFTHSWGGGFGGQAWGAVAQGACELDACMLQLIRIPSRINAKRVLASLTNLVNLAHNNGWFLNKFCGSEWFDLAADLDPRVAIMAGPVWYEATLTPVDARMALFERLSGLQAVDLTKYGKVTASKQATPKSEPAKGGGVIKVALTDPTGEPVYTPPPPAKKQGGLPNVTKGLSWVLPPGVSAICAQCKMDSANSVHVQVGVSGAGVPAGAYYSGVVSGVNVEWIQNVMQGPTLESMGGTSTLYGLLQVDGGVIKTIWGDTLVTCKEGVE